MHGCVRAEFSVEPGLPEELRIGVFKAARMFPAWVRFSNQQRRHWEEVLSNALASGATGELGWRAEWRDDTLPPKDIRGRPPRWRRYAR